jgi:uncharacterized membrane protein YjjP (DUF1212 family)
MVNNDEKESENSSFSVYNLTYKDDVKKDSQDSFKNSVLHCDNEDPLNNYSSQEVFSINQALFAGEEYNDTTIRYLTFCLLVEAMYSYGSPTFRLIGYVDNLKKALNLPEASIRFGLTGLWVSKYRKLEWFNIDKRTDMNKLSRVIALERSLQQGKINCEGVCAELEKIRNSRPLYHELFCLISLPLYAIGFSLFFFGGDRKSILVTFVSGLVIGIYELFSRLGFLYFFSHLHVFILTFITGNFFYYI